MIINPLPEYLDQEGKPILVDIEPDEESAADPQWLKKVKHRVGAIIVEYNYLEREIDDGILEIMNERHEDERVWVFLENMSSSRKIDALSRLYDICSHDSEMPVELQDRKKALFDELDDLRQRRNVYVHANWHNTVSGELVEHRTKRMKSGEYARFRQKISIHDLDNDLNRICKLQDTLYDLHEEILEGFLK